MEGAACSLDFETRSKTDLRKSGVYRYVEDPTTGVWGFAYRLTDGRIQQWRPGFPDPTELLDHVRNGGIVRAHNAAFERNVWNKIVRSMPGCEHWPELLADQQDCTQARAAAVSHPQDLDTLCKAVNADERKDEAGHSLMMKMARPRSITPDGKVVWWDQPENIDRLMLYCEQDVRTETSVDQHIPPLTDYERKVWRFDQLINDRGIRFDIPAVQRAAELVEHAKKEADSEMRKITGRRVAKCTSDNQLIDWIQGRGIECDTVKKGVQDDLIFMAGLNDDTAVRDAINLRRAAKKTSTAKYKAMLLCVCADGRIRGLLNYHGAGPGRWAGRLVQPQNFPRVDYDDEGYIVEWFHSLLADKRLSIKDVYENITAVHGGDYPLILLSRALRSMIRAGDGKKLVGGDFANIEGRKNAWFAGEAWKLQAFRDYDAGTGPDLYKLTASAIAGKDIKDVTNNERQAIGKVPELALGYQGGVGAFIDMGDNYNLDPYQVSPVVLRATTSKNWDEVAALYAQAKDKHGLQEREWTAIKLIVLNWRKKNSRIVQSWWDYQDAAIEAVAAPGIPVSCAEGKVTYYSDGRCLWCVLPSGRMICYAFPEIEEELMEYIDKYTGEEKVRRRRVVKFWGYKEGQWKRLSLYGGLQCENIVQGSSRCVMVDRMFEVERRGYPIILTVHDEIVAEPPDTADYNAKHFEALMSILPPWAAGLPLAAKAWEDQRYVK